MTMTMSSHVAMDCPFSALGALGKVLVHLKKGNAMEGWRGKEREGGRD